MVMAYSPIISLTGFAGLADTEGDHNNLVTLDELENYIGQNSSCLCPAKI
jgi:hypothetical protein